MNTRYENDLYESGQQDREISLNTTTILGIFFALALLCAVFFGFGYSMGRKSAQPSTSPAEVTPRSDNTNSKPAAGSPANPSTSSAGKQSAGETQSAILPLDSPNATCEDNPRPPSALQPAATIPRSAMPPDAHPQP